MRQAAVLVWVFVFWGNPIFSPQGHSEEKEPWPIAVSNYQAPEAGEHPRLLFRRSDLSKLRKRAETTEGLAIVARLREQLGGGESMPTHKNAMTSAYGKQGGPKPQKEDMPVGAYSISHMAGFGLLYQITGDKKYAAFFNNQGLR